MSNSERIVVTTPTGHIGSRVVRLLLQAGVRPVVLVRDPVRLEPDVRELVDVRQGDLRDPAFVRDATVGADALFWLAPEDFTDPDLLGTLATLGTTVADAVRSNSIARTVLLSSVGAERRHGAGLIDGLARIEEQLDATGADVLHLRCGYFFTNLLGNLDAMRAGTLPTPFPLDVPMAWVDPRDIGEVAAARLLARGWSGRQVQAVHGPADLSWTEAAQVLSDATGRTIEALAVTGGAVRDSLTAAGVPAATADGVVAMSTGLGEGFVPEQPRSVVTTTPTTLAAWAFTTLRPLLEQPTG